MTRRAGTATISLLIALALLAGCGDPDAVEQDAGAPASESEPMSESESVEEITPAVVAAADITCNELEDEDADGRSPGSIVADVAAEEGVSRIQLRQAVNDECGGAYHALEERREKAEEEAEPTLSPTPTEAEVRFANVGDTVDVGLWSYTVTGYECGITSLESGMGGSTETPSGQYCRVDANVRNGGTSPELWSYAQMALVDAQGRDFSYDSDATLALSLKAIDDDSGVNEVDRLQPGQTRPFSVAFDLPADARAGLVILVDDLYAPTDGIGIRLF